MAKLIRPLSNHYDKFGRIINDGARVLAPWDNGIMVLGRVEALHPIMIRVKGNVGGYKGVTKLFYPKQLVVYPLNG